MLRPAHRRGAQQTSAPTVKIFTCKTIALSKLDFNGSSVAFVLLSAGCKPLFFHLLFSDLSDAKLRPAVVLADEGRVEMLDMDRAQFAAFVAGDFAKWAKVVKDANITAE